METCNSNLKSVVLGVLKQLVFKAQTGRIDHFAAHKQTDKRIGKNIICVIDCVHLAEITKHFYRAAPVKCAPVYA